MDADQFVPISIIAGFRKIVQLTNDYNLILQVLRESNQVEVDERGEKVRSVCRRCTIILREISEQHRDEVEKMLSGGPPYVDLKYGLNNSWYVTFDSEETTQQAYLHLQNMNITFNNKPICVSICVYLVHVKLLNSSGVFVRGLTSCNNHVSGPHKSRGTSKRSATYRQGASTGVFLIFFLLARGWLGEKRDMALFTGYRFGINFN
ncbi:unnamed protein product [Angiostrongylus costaricensis]|uniref:HTH La-type RNA-binding domain-containing protein n=1 Tax=Angiostrongylus costaricensis TaxID=334426 RepID=A0A0R3PDC7_ANGCS|nr:unnamed protein product [Angiostrongylus costaricensis]